MNRTEAKISQNWSHSRLWDGVHVPYFQVVRLAQALFLIVVFLAGQVHACPPVWVSSDGSPCDACPSGPCEDSLESPGSKAGPLSVEAPQDCHSCCAMRSCQEGGDHQVDDLTVQMPPVLDFAQTYVVEMPLSVVEPRPVHIQVERGFPNAPPGRHASRAPPFPLS